MADPQWLTAEEVAEMLNISARTIRRKAANGELQAVRIGDGVRAPLRIRADMVEDLLRDAQP